MGNSQQRSKKPRNRSNSTTTFLQAKDATASGFVSSQSEASSGDPYSTVEHRAPFWIPKNQKAHPKSSDADQCNLPMRMLAPEKRGYLNFKRTVCYDDYPTEEESTPFAFRSESMARSAYNLVKFEVNKKINQAITNPTTFWISTDLLDEHEKFRKERSNYLEFTRSYVLTEGGIPFRLVSSRSSTLESGRSMKSADDSTLGTVHSESAATSDAGAHLPHKPSQLGPEPKGARRGSVYSSKNTAEGAAVATAYSDAEMNYFVMLVKFVCSEKANASVKAIKKTKGRVTLRLELADYNLNSDGDDSDDDGTKVEVLETFVKKERSVGPLKVPPTVRRTTSAPHLESQRTKDASIQLTVATPAVPAVYQGIVWVPDCELSVGESADKGNTKRGPQHTKKRKNGPHEGPLKPRHAFVSLVSSADDKLPDVL